MLDEMTVGQLQEWIAFNSLEPFWEERIGDLFGSIVQTLANIYRDKKKRRRAFELKDVRLFWGDENKKGPTDWKLAAQNMRLLATMMKLRAEKKAAGEPKRV